jgi:hypothetical protein
MTDLCHEFGISRKTGYKIVDRYQQCGVQGLTVSSVLMSLHAMAMILTSSGTFLWHLLAIAINIWIVVYLRKPHVKEAFGVPDALRCRVMGTGHAEIYSPRER